MTFSAKYEANGQITAGPLSDGQTWSGITPGSRFYAEVMDLTKNGADIAPYEPSSAPIPTLSRRQFFQQAAIAGVISESEALAAVTTGVLPAAITAFIGTLPADQQFGAKMLFSVSDFVRSSPMADAFGQTLGMTSEQIDDFFTAASQL